METNQVNLKREQKILKGIKSRKACDNLKLAKTEQTYNSQIQISNNVSGNNNLIANGGNVTVQNITHVIKVSSGGTVNLPGYQPQLYAPFGYGSAPRCTLAYESSPSSIISNAPTGGT